MDDSIDTIDAGLAAEEPSIGPDPGGAPVYDRDPEPFEKKVDAVLESASDLLMPGPKVLNAIPVPGDVNVAKPDREPEWADDPFHEIETFGDGPEGEYAGDSGVDSSVPEQPDASLASGSPPKPTPSPGNQAEPDSGGIGSGPDQNYSPAHPGGSEPSYTPADGGVSSGPGRNYSPAEGS
jgi:hypothetical protein